MHRYSSQISELEKGNFIALARVLTIVENELEGSSDLLKEIKIDYKVPVIGITGPPGAGKSTLVNAVITDLSEREKKIAVVAVDPTSPFNLGSLLGDRIRMSAHFNRPNVFIRSVATRGSVGGLSSKIIEMVDVLRSAGFDYVIVETVGVGQSELEIAGLADVTVVVLVPEAGDEIQHIKSGLMEIGDAFVLNKADRAGADVFAHGLKKLLHARTLPVPVFKTIAEKNIGVNELVEWLIANPVEKNHRKSFLYTERAFKLIQGYRVKDIRKQELQQQMEAALERDDFNLYRFVAPYLDV